MSRTLYLTNHALNVFATPYLFKRVRLPWGRQVSIARMEALSKFGYLEYIKHLMIPLEIISLEYMKPELGLEQGQDVDDWSEELLPHLSGFFKQCPSNLLRLSIGSVGDLDRPCLGGTDSLETPLLEMEPRSAYYKIPGKALNAVRANMLEIHVHRLLHSEALRAQAESSLKGVRGLRIYYKANDAANETFTADDIQWVEGDLGWLITSLLAKACEFRSLYIDCEQSESRIISKLNLSSTLTQSLRYLSLVM